MILNAVTVEATVPNNPPMFVAVVEAEVTPVAVLDAPPNDNDAAVPTLPIRPPTLDVPVMVPVASDNVSLSVRVFPELPAIDPIIPPVAPVPVFVTEALFVNVPLVMLMGVPSTKPNRPPAFTAPLVLILIDGLVPVVANVEAVSLNVALLAIKPIRPPTPELAAEPFAVMVILGLLAVVANVKVGLPENVVKII